MPQSPLLVDQISIEPGSPGDRIISRGADGSIQFTDSLVTSPVTLSQISGAGTIAGVRVVGSSGAGAQYTSIQDAIDSIPPTSSITEPYVILIHPGVYTEDVSLYRDGVALIAVGPVTLESALEATPDAVGNDHTLTIEAASGTVPQWVWIRGLKITNAHQNKACVACSGGVGSNVGLYGINLENCILEPVSALGNYPVRADVVNQVRWLNGSVRNASTFALVIFDQCASVEIDGVRDLTAMQITYSNLGDLPALVTCENSIYRCDDVASGTALTPFWVSLTGVGSLQVVGCAGFPDATVEGDRTVTFRESLLADLTVNDTANVVMVNSSILGTLTGAVGSSVLRSNVTGAQGFVGSSSETVTFDAPQPDFNYYVFCTPSVQPANTEVPFVTNKSATGFDIEFSTNQTLTVDWLLVR